MQHYNDIITHNIPYPIMEKESYETYEYLPAPESTPEVEPYQFFVVQDDGTFLINRQVQYVTQVEAAKQSEDGQPCTMLDVTPQQFYVDVDNAGEMTVPEQFNIPEGTSNLYTSSYLLQPGAIEQVENNTEDQIKPNILHDNTTPNKQSSNLTEVTISDEQYRLLEQKGWVLVELNGKVYILDTLGLHDITSNEKLIEKLKADSATINLEPDTSQFKIEYLPLDGIDTEMKGGINIEINSLQSEEKLEPTPETECETDLSLIVDETKGIVEEDKEQKPQWDENISTGAAKQTVVDNLNQEPCENWTDENVLRIRSDFCLKDIPEKIVLGKTRKGKRLVCRILKPEREAKQAVKPEVPRKVKTKQTYHQDNTGTCLNDLDDVKLDRIFRMSFGETSVPYNADDVKLIERVVKRLLQLPAVKSSIINRNLLVTKITVIEQKSLIIESSPTLVTGKVVSLNRVWHFLHKPDFYATAKEELSKPLSETGEGHNFLHMHLHEIQRDDRFGQIAVILDKRRLLEPSSTLQSEKIVIPDLPLNFVNETFTPNSTYGFACGMCASIFKTEKELNQHKETHEMDTDDKETEKTQDNNLGQNGICVVMDLHTKTKNYACMHCKAKFSRINNCQRHVKTHGDKETSGAKKMFKCEICSSFFRHSPTLLKHIMKSHIKVEK